MEALIPLFLPGTVMVLSGATRDPTDLFYESSVLWYYVWLRLKLEINIQGEMFFFFFLA